jgi:hypothetical protein
MKLRDIMWTAAISGIIIVVDNKHCDMLRQYEHFHSETQNDQPPGHPLTWASGSVSNGTTSNFRILL